MSNRPSHYKKHFKKPRERQIMLSLNGEILKQIEYIAWFENQTRARIIEAAIRFYFLKKAKGQNEAYIKSKKCYKTNKISTTTKLKYKNKKRSQKAKDELYSLF